MPVPAGWLARSPEAEIPDCIQYPVIVKPNREDASLGINAGSVIGDRNSLKKRIQSVIRRYDQPALVEAFIPHREFNAAVWENGRGPEVLAVQEIDFSSMPSGEPRICGYEAKWFEDHPLYRSTVPVCPAPLEPAVQRKIESISLEAFQALGCRDYARVDFRMDAEGKLYILEVNPNPDVSRNAGFARALGVAGIDYTDFWLALIRRALTRKETE
ncbi:MAG TPA: ATP-grasp domain-containing protein [bacterium]|nr:ATP-grasp domain-containing protein [bacterium]